MICIYKKPGAAPGVREIDNTLEALQGAVGGYIEVCTIAEDCAIICNEDGRWLGLPHNCKLLGVDFVGTILVVGVREDGFCDLSGRNIVAVMQRLFGEEGASYATHH